MLEKERDRPFVKVAIVHVECCLLNRLEMGNWGESICPHLFTSPTPLPSSDDCYYFQGVSFLQLGV